MTNLLIKNGMIYCMSDKLKEVFVGDILIEDGKIKEIANSISSDVKVIDAKGKFIFPGIIDAHSHIGMFDFNHQMPNDDANEMTNPILPAMDARYGIDPKAREFEIAYKNGVTSMLLTPGSGNVFCGQAIVTKTYGNNIFDMTIKAPAAVKIALGGNPKNTYGEVYKMPMTRMGVANILWETFEKAKRYLEKKSRGDKIDYNPELEAIIPALKRELPCKIHCTQHDMLIAIEVANYYDLKFSIEHAWGATNYIEELIDCGCDICYGPIATYRAPGERRKVDIEAVKILDDRGVNVSIITDSPILSEESIYHHIGEAVREGVKPYRAMRMVTINPAKQLFIDDRLGSIEQGKDADIVIFNKMPGLDTDATVVYTIIDGKIVFTNDELI